MSLTGDDSRVNQYIAALLVSLFLSANNGFAQAPIDEVVVKAEKLEKIEELGLSSVELSGEEMITKLGATLGETLGNEPGVHNASYGPGVGLPVLRGLSGVRVLLTEDGIGAWDASAISPDHATTVESALAESIRLIKGPATVIYGNNAIGGTVEVKNGRIAESLHDKPLAATFEHRKELVNDHERESYVGKLRTELGRFVAQIDGFLRKSNDISIPGLAIQEQAIEEVFGFPNTDNSFETVLNTDAESDSGSFSLSYVDDTFYIGASSILVNNDYGLPPGAHTEPEDSPGHTHITPVGEAILALPRVRIDLEQERHILKLGGEISNSKIDSYTVTLANVEYTHDESEFDPETNIEANGTRFFNEVFEVKAELEHTLFSNLNSQHNGRLGLQLVDREFSARSNSVFGGEDFIPATDQQALGVFFYEAFPFASGTFEFGGRYEWQEITQREPTAALLPDNLQFFHEPITYQTYTLSASLTSDINDQNRLIFSLSSAQRAPEIQELLSLGPHLATRSYDIGLLIRPRGDGPPKPEQFYGAEIRWEWSSILGDMNTALFYTQAKDFIFQARPEDNGLFDIATQGFVANCTDLDECVAVFNYTQSDVTLSGYEWQWLLPSVTAFSGDFQVEFFADFARGRIDAGGDLPRLPPRRQGIGLNWTSNTISSELRYSYVSDQNNSGFNEADTEGYNLLNGRISYTHPIGYSGDQSVLIFLQMNNLLDEEIRKSTSFLRNFTPEPGREISFGLRYQY